MPAPAARSADDHAAPTLPALGCAPTGFHSTIRAETLETLTRLVRWGALAALPPSGDLDGWAERALCVTLEGCGFDPETPWNGRFELSVDNSETSLEYTIGVAAAVNLDGLERAARDYGRSPRGRSLPSLQRIVAFALLRFAQTLIPIGGTFDAHDLKSGLVERWGEDDELRRHLAELRARLRPHCRDQRELDRALAEHEDNPRAVLGAVRPWTNRSIYGSDGEARALKHLAMWKKRSPNPLTAFVDRVLEGANELEELASDVRTGLLPDESATWDCGYPGASLLLCNTRFAQALGDEYDVYVQDGPAPTWYTTLDTRESCGALRQGLSAAGRIVRYAKDVIATVEQFEEEYRDYRFGPDR